MLLARDSAPLKVQPPPKLLDRVRTAIRARHSGLRTEEAYIGWIRRFVLFHNKRHAANMGAVLEKDLGLDIVKGSHLHD